MRLLLLALLLPSPFIQTTTLPTYGSLDAIKNQRRVYVASENEDSRRRIIKALAKDKTLEVVGSPDEAQFFIEYGELSREATVTGIVTNENKERQQRNQMRVFTIGPDNRRIIVWSETGSRETEHFMGMKMYDSGRSESALTSKFLKALKRFVTRPRADNIRSPYWSPCRG